MSKEIIGRRKFLEVSLATLLATACSRRKSPSEQSEVSSSPDKKTSAPETFEAEESLGYPEIKTPDPSRQPEFPNTESGGQKALAEYGESFESGDYFQTGHGDVDLPQYHFRVLTAGEIELSQLGIAEKGSGGAGSLVVLVNHFGETAMFRDAKIDNGFTVAGRVWDMSQPEKVTEAAQALLDHYTGRMTKSDNQGANCGTIDGCKAVNWHVIVVGNGEKQAHWKGHFQR
jgi:hypothetical protein